MRWWPWGKKAEVKRAPVKPSRLHQAMAKLLQEEGLQAAQLYIIGGMFGKALKAVDAEGFWLAELLEAQDGAIVRVRHELYLSPKDII